MKIFAYIVFLFASFAYSSDLQKKNVSVAEQITASNKIDNLLKKLEKNHEYYKQLLLLEFTKLSITQLNEHPFNRLAIVIAYSKLLSFIFYHVQNEDISEAITQINHNYLFDVEIEVDFWVPSEIEIPQKFKTKNAKLLYILSYVSKEENFQDYFTRLYIITINSSGKKIKKNSFELNKNTYLATLDKILNLIILDKKSTDKHKKSKINTAKKVIKKTGEISFNALEKSLDVLDFVIGVDDTDYHQTYYTRW